MWTNVCRQHADEGEVTDLAKKGNLNSYMSTKVGNDEVKDNTPQNPRSTWVLRTQHNVS